MRRHGEEQLILRAQDAADTLVLIFSLILHSKWASAFSDASFLVHRLGVLLSIGSKLMD
jgi:hypothetical protein